MSVLYYYYYLFYNRILRERDPHTFAIVGLSGSIFFIVLGLGMLISDCFCYIIPKNFWIIILIMIPLLLNIYFKNKKDKIIALKPTFRGSSMLSFWVTLFFGLFGISLLFVGPFVGDLLREKFCK